MWWLFLIFVESSVLIFREPESSLWSTWFLIHHDSWFIMIRGTYFELILVMVDRGDSFLFSQWGWQIATMRLWMILASWNGKYLFILLSIFIYFSWNIYLASHLVRFLPCWLLFYDIFSYQMAKILSLNFQGSIFLRAKTLYYIIITFKVLKTECEFEYTRLAIVEKVAQFSPFIWVKVDKMLRKSQAQFLEVLKNWGSGRKVFVINKRVFSELFIGQPYGWVLSSAI